LPILAFAFKSVSADRKEVKGQAESINIDSTPMITSVKETDLPMMEKQKGLLIEFEFNTTYKPEIGRMKFAGELMYTGEDLKKIMKDWQKDKKLPVQTDAEVKNFLFKRCLTLAVNISDQLQLPAPLGFPTIMLKKDDGKTNYIG
jgi:hypothetical protein